MRQLIGNSATKNSQSVKFLLQLRTVSPHLCRMVWMTIKRAIAPGPMNNGVTSCLPYSLKTRGKGQKPRSRRFPILELRLYLTATDPSGSRGRRRLGMVSYAPTKYPIERHLSITVPRDIACFARSQECLSEIICRIVPRTSLTHTPTGP